MEYLLSERCLAVIPSLQANSPYAVLNCLSAAVPFLCSRVGGTGELLAHEDVGPATFEPVAEQLHSKLLRAIASGAHAVRPALDPLICRQSWQQWHRLVSHMPTKSAQGDARSSPASWPLVTVCIPHFNRANYLHQALDSILAQDYPAIEVIVVDDGSTNPAVQSALLEVEQQLSNRGWSLLRQEHANVGAARNRAARHARGEYLLFMDDDNYAKPHELSTLVSVALNTGADIITCFIDFFSGVDPPCLNEKARRCRTFLGAAVAAGAFDNVFGDTNALVRRKTFLDLGGYVEDHATPAEDWEFYASAVLKGARLEVVPEALFWYRETADNRSATIPRFAGYSGVLRSYKKTVPAALEQLIVCAQGMFLQQSDSGGQDHTSRGRRLQGTRAAAHSPNSLTGRGARLITQEPIDDKLVSVCLPVYNGEKFLEEALESVLSQSYDKLELLIADDGSTDRSREIIYEYARRDSRIKAWTNRSRLGLFANYNSCMSRAIGTLIKPFAQDDCWAPDLLEKCVYTMERHPGVVLASTARNRIGEDGNPATRSDVPDAGDYFGAAVPVAGYDVIKRALLSFVNFVGEPSSVIFRTSCAGRGFDERYSQSGDLEYWLRILCYGDYLFISEPLCKFRLHEASATRENERTIKFLPDIFRLGVQFQWFLQCAGSDFGPFVAGALRFVSRHISVLLKEERLSLAELLDADADGSPESNEYDRFRLSALLATIAISAESSGDSEQPPSRRIRMLEEQLRELLTSGSWRATRVLREFNRWLGSSPPKQERLILSYAEKADQRTEYIKYLRKQIITIKNSRSWKLCSPMRAVANLGLPAARPGEAKSLSRADCRQEAALEAGYARQLKLADRFSVLLEGSKKTPRCLGVLLCDNHGAILRDAVEALLAERHAVVVWDFGSADQTADVLSEYADSLLEWRRVPREPDLHRTYLALSEHLRSHYIDEFDWISWPDQSQMLEGPRRELSYYEYVTAVFNSPFDFVQFRNFIYRVTDEDDQTIASPVERLKRYSLWSERRSDIRAWRAQLTDARMFGQDPVSGQRFPFLFNLRQYPQQSLPPVSARLLHLDNGGELKPAEMFPVVCI